MIEVGHLTMQDTRVMACLDNLENLKSNQGKRFLLQGTICLSLEFNV
jgi:hypothetical protein